MVRHEHHRRTSVAQGCYPASSPTHPCQPGEPFTGLSELSRPAALRQPARCSLPARERWLQQRLVAADGTLELQSGECSNGFAVKTPQSMKRAEKHPWPANCGTIRSCSRNLVVRPERDGRWSARAAPPQRAAPRDRSSVMRLRVRVGSSIRVRGRRHHHHVLSWLPQVRAAG